MKNDEIFEFIDNTLIVRLKKPKIVLSKYRRNNFNKRRDTSFKPGHTIHARRKARKEAEEKESE